jgi:hypothetical protein
MPHKDKIELKGEFMKTRNLQTMLAVMIGAGLAWPASTILAQDSFAAQPSAVNAPVPQLSYGTSQILRLAQANVSDDTIMAYIKSSGNSYGLDANQIIYLRQQGISSVVITAMLNQPITATVVATPATPPAQPVASTSSAAPVPTPTVAPSVTYVQTVPATTYYQPYYYPAFAIYPAVSLSFGWGGYYRGGYYGNWHGGGWHR